MTDVSESDLADLRASVRAVLEQASSEESVRTTMATDCGVDRDLWQALAADLDILGLAVPETAGGAGAGWSVQRVVLEELGRSLACVPALSVIGLGLPSLLASGDETALARFLPDVLSGQSIVTAALLGTDPLSDCDVRASRKGDGWRITGRIPHVLDGQVADQILVLAHHDEGLALFALDARADGVSIEPRRMSDQTRRVVGIVVADAPACLVGGPDGGAAIARDVRPHALFALACEQTGGAAAVLEQSVTYAGQRVQFGRAIGSFQAIKHKLAEVLVSVEECRSATWATARALDDADPNAELFAHASAAVCSAAYVAAASSNVQVHGGIGYTWEHPAHLYVKRSRGSALILGTPTEHRARVTQLLPLLAQHAHSTPEAGPVRDPEGALR